MIQPVNNHLLIEPLKHQTFLQAEKGTFEEIGTVLALPITEEGKVHDISPVKIGDKVFFDSWLAAKYPKPDAKTDDDFYWLVEWKDVRAIEHEENKIST